MPTYSDLKAAQRRRGGSLRAKARRILARRCCLDAKAAGAGTIAADTKPVAAGKESMAFYSAPPKLPTALTLKVRALYESSVVPVRELARLAGVSERTLYKYVQRGGWQRRYPRRSLCRGAGGRFVTAAQAARPVASGLKALDPGAAAQALAACAEAGRSARHAAGAALDSEHLLRDFETHARRLASLTVMLKAMAASPRARRRL